MEQHGYFIAIMKVDVHNQCGKWVNMAISILIVSDFG
jgi:hypothetical protein